MNLEALLSEPDADILVTRHELLKLCAAMDYALDGGSNDTEHTTLYWAREVLADFLEDPDRRWG
jgi:hypothetical protein